MSLKFGPSKPRGAFSRANKLLLLSKPSASSSDNPDEFLEIVHETLKNQTLEKDARELLVQFTKLRGSYKGSCDQNSIDTVGFLYRSMLNESSKSILKIALHRTYPLGSFVMQAHDRLVNECLDEFVGSYRSVARETYEAQPHFYKKSLQLVSTKANSDSQRSVIQMMRKLLADSQRVRFDHLRHLSSTRARNRWFRFMHEMLKDSNMKAQNLAYQIDQQRSEDEISFLFDEFFAKRCERLLSSERADILSRASQLLSWCNTNSINYDSFAHEYWNNAIPMSVNYRICVELKGAKTKEFISELTRTYNNRLIKLFG